MKQYLIDRISEASTWRGLAMFATACGVAISPEQVNAIVTAGLMLSGIIGVFAQDKK